MREQLLPTLQQWLLFTGAAVVVGCVAWRLLVARGAAKSLDTEDVAVLGRVGGRVASVGLLTSLLLIGVWGLRGAVQLINFRDPFVPIMEDVSFLLGETWGKVWMGQGVLIPLLAVAFWRARVHEAIREADGTASPVFVAWHAAALLVLLLAATLALSSHAMGVATARPLIVTADALHALAAGAWIGSLALIVTAGRARRSVFAAQLRSFSPLALVSCSTLIAMGVVLSWTHLGTPTNLWTTSYGRVLSAKVGTAGLVFLLGFLNWRLGLPESDTEEGAAGVRRRATWEVVFAGAVMLVTAVLVHTAKP